MSTTLLNSAEKDLAADMLAASLDRFFAERYPGVPLKRIARSSLQHTESGIARMLRAWREANGWPELDTTGEVRCVICHALLGDEPSACEDEDVCLGCALSDSPVAVAETPAHG